ncbi:hypothetical protein C474_15989 [Halogeometricum pallidum JCM 14848]|uniref:UbiA prenyltransferase n=1 Tax=Halogeometricum pallidum JCM 14848 TaxID=1227487 RepID=M0D041_HALPD|nr:hypothetical protein [Halogeometricum pallidum]ELZ28017.1 hypothetical protein C474_15989 [Halogeometricum pallidum JCM 14848]
MDAAPTTGLRALATRVKPPFMAPAVGTALFGALLAPSASPAALCLHLVCVASALYIVHPTGANVSLDRPDRSFDRQVGKRTVPVVLGNARAAAVLCVRAPPREETVSGR